MAIGVALVCALALLGCSEDVAEPDSRTAEQAVSVQPSQQPYTPLSPAEFLEATEPWRQPGLEHLKPSAEAEQAMYASTPLAINPRGKALQDAFEAAWTVEQRKLADQGLSASEVATLGGDFKRWYYFFRPETAALVESIDANLADGGVQ